MAAPSSADIAALKQEIAAIRDSYEARLRALEQRLKLAIRKPPVQAIGNWPMRASSHTALRL